MTIAVTAASGQLGRLVVDALLTRVPATEVVAVIRDAAKAQPLADLGVEVRIASYDDPEALRAALVGVEKVLLISGSEIGRRFEQHRNVVDAAVATGVQQLVYTSATAADTSTLPVAPEHRQTEEHLASTVLDHVVLRNGWYHENYLPTIESARQTGSVLTSAGAGRVSSASRADFAEAAAIALTTDQALQRVLELGGDHAWTQDELAATIAEVIGSPVTVAQVDRDQHAEILTGAGLDAGLVGFLVATDASISRGELDVRTGDLSSLLGRPTTPLAETLRQGA